MTMSDFRISWCEHIYLCKKEDLANLKYVGKKLVKSGVKKHYEYIYLLWTDKEKGKGIYYRSCELLGGITCP